MSIMKKEDLTKKSMRRLMAIGDYDKEKMEVFPFRDWHIVTILFGLGFIVSVGYHVYLFMNINEDNFFATVPSVTEEVPVFDEEKIIKTILLFDEQDARFERLKMASTTTADPSL